MAGALAVELPEPLDVVERDGGLAEGLVVLADRLHLREVEDRIEEHRRVADRQHEAVAVRPDRVGRVEVEELLPERVDDGRHGHRRAGVPRIRRLDRVHGERSDRIDAQRLDARLGAAHGPPWCEWSAAVAAAVQVNARIEGCRCVDGRGTLADRAAL